MIPIAKGIIVVLRALHAREQGLLYWCNFHDQCDLLEHASRIWLTKLRLREVVKGLTRTHRELDRNQMINLKTLDFVGSVLSASVGFSDGRDRDLNE